MTTALRVEVRDHTRLVHRSIDLTTKASIKVNPEEILKRLTTRKAETTNVVHPILEIKKKNGTPTVKFKPVTTKIMMKNMLTQSLNDVCHANKR